MLFEKLWQNRQKWYWSVIGWICFIRRFWKQNHFGFFKLWRKNVFLLLSPLQSAYRPNHSTETALLRIVNDLPTATDNNKICILTLLDLSAAFDTIDHQILLTRLQHSFGISGPALSWFLSCLCNRTRAVTINSLQSEYTTLHYGIPMGSVLGPVLFILYTQPLFNLASKHAVSHHAFADDNH